MNRMYRIIRLNIYSYKVNNLLLTALVVIILFLTNTNFGMWLVTCLELEVVMGSLKEENWQLHDLLPANELSQMSGLETGWPQLMASFHCYLHKQ